MQFLFYLGLLVKFMLSLLQNLSAKTKKNLEMISDVWLCLMPHEILLGNINKIVVNM